MALAALCFAIPAFADGGSTVMDLAPVGVGLGMGLAAGLCGLGQGKAVARPPRRWRATLELGPAC